MRDFGNLKETEEKGARKGGEKRRCNRTGRQRQAKATQAKRRTGRRSSGQGGHRAAEVDTGRGTPRGTKRQRTEAKGKRYLNFWLTCKSGISTQRTAHKASTRVDSLAMPVSTSLVRIWSSV